MRLGGKAGVRWHATGPNYSKGGFTVKKSKYTLVFKRADGSFLLYNTATAALASVAEDLEVILADGDEDEVRALIEEDFVVPSDAEDSRIRDSFLEDVYFGRNSLSTTILTTYDCNFACPYCFQESMHSSTAMSTDTALLVAEWVERAATELRPEHFFMCLTGGEPLVKLDTCCYLADRFRTFFDKVSVPQSFSMVTNGWLLSPSVLDDLRRLGIKRYLIDVDGPKEHHDTYRILRSGEPTFDKIMDNAENVVQHDDTTLIMKVGLTQANAPQLESFLDELTSRGFRRENFIVAPAVISNNLATTCFGQIKLPQLDVLVDLCKAKGYRTRETLRVPGPCFAKLGTSYVLGPEGAVYHCPILVNSRKWAIGTIPEMPIPKYNKTNAPRLSEQCMNCELLPTCLGGCLYHAELEGPPEATCSRSRLISEIERALLSCHPSILADDEESRDVASSHMGR